MKNIAEFSPQTSMYELACHFTDKIVAGEITTFGELREYAESVPDGRNTREAFTKAFERIRKMNWGLFSGLDIERYPKLWERFAAQGASSVVGSLPHQSAFGLNLSSR